MVAAKRRIRRMATRKTNENPEGTLIGNLGLLEDDQIKKTGSNDLLVDPKENQAIRDRSLKRDLRRNLLKKNRTHLGIDRGLESNRGDVLEIVLDPCHVDGNVRDL